jgi:helix-turn-helix protein
VPVQATLPGFDEVLSVKQARQYLGVDSRTFEWLHKDGFNPAFPVYRRGGARLYLKSDLDLYKANKSRDQPGKYSTQQ